MCSVMPVINSRNTLIVGFDPGATTGISGWQRKRVDGQLMWKQVLSDQAKTLPELINKLKNDILTESDVLCIIEQVSPRNPATMHANTPVTMSQVGEVIGCIKTMNYLRGMGVVEMTKGEINRFVCGNPKAKKEEVHNFVCAEHGFKTWRELGSNDHKRDAACVVLGYLRRERL